MNHVMIDIEILDTKPTAAISMDGIAKAIEASL